MKILAEISEGSLGLGEYEQLETQYRLRKSARGIVVNDVGDIAVQYLKNYTFHKLPGGGVDPGETIDAALRREIKEEVGCGIMGVASIGTTIEYRNKYKMLHISYGFSAHVDGEVGKPMLEEGEIEEGMETLWMKPGKALERMYNDEPKKFEGHFILKREISFLEEYLRKP